MTDEAWTKPDWTKPDWLKSTHMVARNSAIDQAPGSDARSVVTMGWQPDVPDIRDQNLATKRVRDNLAKAKSAVLSDRALPATCDNRQFCSPIEDQGSLGSCTAQAVVGLMEYMMRRGMDDHIDGSRLFTYKVTRKLMGLQGDTGATLRAAMKAVAAFGVPPERYWPYDIAEFETEPTPFLYSFAQSYQALDYTRLDPPGTSQDDVEDNILRVLAAGFPIAFGFSVYSSLSRLPDVPFPTPTDTLQGGHAVLAVGYDKDREATVPAAGGGVEKISEPSLLIRNSWGRDWGDDGYGYLPIRYVTYGLAQDFWTSFKWEWIDTRKFN